MFSHEKLTVYQKALPCVAALNQNTLSWDKRHAVVDHLHRASESLLLNLVEGARLRGAANRQHYAEYAIGSALECAACLDVGVLKGFLAESRSEESRDRTARERRANVECPRRALVIKAIEFRLDQVGDEVWDEVA